MCSRQDKLDRFFILKAEIQAFFALKTEHKQVHQKFLIQFGQNRRLGYKQVKQTKYLEKCTFVEMPDPCQSVVFKMSDSVRTPCQTLAVTQS